MKHLIPYVQSFSVPFEYPVYFTTDLFSPDNPALALAAARLHERRRHRFMIFVDSGVAAAHENLTFRMREYFESRSADMRLAADPAVVPGGESAKNGWEHVHDIIGAINRHRLDRQSYIVAVGGGAVLDMVGFAAALVHRGLRLLRVPTTTLAQNDAGIGVKNGINDQGQKNYIGTFAPPFAVLNDAAFLTTLTFEQWIGGISEAFKVAIIKDAAFFEFLVDAAAALRARDGAVMEEAVRRCAILHLDHIRNTGDPFEFGSARPLDFGHWAAHKLESMSGFTMGHGQAVAVGIALDAYIAVRQGLMAEADFIRIVYGLQACGLPVWEERLHRRAPDGSLEILAGLAQFREHLGGDLMITLPNGIGGKVEVGAVEAEDVAAAIAVLRDCAGRTASAFGEITEAPTRAGRRCGHV
ncbi:3-dehydroquinate synthase [Desulfococcus sp.]|uniref:3-dehydroquinate synthase n=1 Tax=Desulfococcus sp. TaxID=2025834 RepID=UPI003593ED41